MHLDHINLNTLAPEKMARFYETVLDMSVTTLGDNYWHCSAAGRNILLSTGEPGLGFGAFACDSKEEFSELRERVATSGSEIVTFTSPLFNDGNTLAVRDPDGNLQVFSFSEADVGSAKETPLLGRLQHLVVATDNLEEMNEFYESVVGFQLSDKVVDDKGEVKVCFLRGDHEHHCFAMFGASSKRLDHHCYEVGEWNLIRDWADHLVAKDVKIVWGPGRHGAGNNLFLMFNDPDGNYLEISAELESIGPGREVGIWDHSEKSLNLWGRGMIRT